ncbi:MULTISPECIES: D-amino acid dehydrogenase [unclassified Pseudomonas]|uniref:D-amino acid dehydrogenase n=1 Tax=unclassified Pseudomonas TaxID=196821 RepID=UPI002AC91A29|nr:MULTISPECIES: D-amino acid dehydrogenase [unclassified Pseudomonas]MEB0042585.1 D-amino acid dehydrogenase [Pseudomonas sp. MH10]MEB0120736.1 D-amino acid dehydrogenase [Pseudomonas sp. CCI1.2]WPX64520.1 D-amino acid dehydrogenase [Pseudomonas sp. MH10]
MARRVSIIGAGVIGLTTAYALVREGFEVDLIDAQTELASQASFANGGQLSYRYVSPLADAGVPVQALAWMLRGDSPLKLRPTLDIRQWRWISAFLWACRGSVNRRNAEKLLRLAMHSRDTLEKWRESDRLDDFGWRRNGKLVTFRSASSFNRSRSYLCDPKTQQVLGATELVTVEPTLAGSSFVGAIFTPDEEVGDCHRFCLSLASRLRASGRCNFMLGRPVTRINQSNGVVQSVELGGDVYAVDHLVLCAGYRSVSLTLPGLHLPIYPLKGYSLTVPIEAGHRPPDISITDYDRKVVYARLGEQLRIAAMVDIVGFDTSIDQRRITSMREAAQALFPNGGDYQNAVEWAGMRPATPTGVPIIGATPYQNLWINGGHGALGFTLACASADLLSQEIAGRIPTINLQGFAPRAA